MSERMALIPFNRLIGRIMDEYRRTGSVFGIRADKFYSNKGAPFTLFGERLASLIGPAAGPNSQLAQNIVAAYLAGARFIELKTIQVLDGEDLRRLVPRPCINARDEGYNVEWSTELTAQEAFDEYVKAWFALHVCAAEFDLSDDRDFMFNMSVGYDLAGVRDPKVDGFIEGLKDASGTKVWNECAAFLRGNMSMFERFTPARLDAVAPRVCGSATLSTLHGCPPDEIERIARHLLGEKLLHTYVKCNPTLLGYERARGILDGMGYGYVPFDRRHFENDLQFEDAARMFRDLLEYSGGLGLRFGVKLTNTLPVRVENGELPGEEMYMSGRALYPLSLNVADMLTREFDRNHNKALPISYSGGADFFNIEDIVRLGIRPVTMATTILKPGGYERLNQLASRLEGLSNSLPERIDAEGLSALAAATVKNRHYLKSVRYLGTAGSRKTGSALGLFDCFKSPCADGGCPINQQIPEYLKLVGEGRYAEAFKIIAIDNALPSVTGAICSHPCQTRCTRMDYEEPLHIRDSKRMAAEGAQEAYTAGLSAAPLKTDKSAVVIGAGPAGIAAAVYLRRNGVAVTVREKRDRPMGIVEYAIPGFRIAPDVIKRDCDMAVKLGVAFEFGAEADYSVEELKRSYDFVILATGAWESGGPVASVTKRGGERLFDALEFLESSKENGCRIDLGGRVAVIGGGDVAMDCARAAKRAPGNPDVVILYRRTRPYMPAEYEEIELALEEGVRLVELTAPHAFDGEKLVCQKMELAERDASGRRGVRPTGETAEMAFDTVIAATGARVGAKPFADNGIALNRRGLPELNGANETSIPGVYAAGDCKAGPSTIVSAMADGKLIARDILGKLGIESDFVRADADYNDDALFYRKGVLAEPAGDARDNYRCLACGRLCEICCDVCPNRANVAVPVGGMGDARQILHIDGMCNECGNCGTFCPHSGDPYKDKMTLFNSEALFDDSVNRGFLPLPDGMFKIRLEDGSVITAAPGDGKMPESYEKFIGAALKMEYLLY